MNTSFFSSRCPNPFSTISKHSKTAGNARTSLITPVAEDRTWAPPVLLRDGVLIKDHRHLTMWSLNPKDPIR